MGETVKEVYKITWKKTGKKFWIKKKQLICYTTLGQDCTH